MRKRRIVLLSSFLVILAFIGFISMEKNKLPSVEAVETTGVEINPIAKYEFLDPTNPGKDTMGNYNLNIMYAAGNDSSTGGVSVSNGVASFNGTAGLVSGSEENDISEKLESFTLTYKISAPVAPAGWAEPIGFGWNDWTANKWFTFMYVGDTNLRFTTASARVPGIEPDTTIGNVDGNANQYWGPVIADISTEKTITITVELGGNIVAYVDGNAVLTYETPENYSLSDPTLQFAMGCVGHWGGQNWWTGELSNVAIYDFALTKEQVSDYLINDKITETAFVAEALAKYEFLDPTNPGKDSMGNYNLNLIYAAGYDASNGGVSVSNGVASFNGTAGLVSGNVENDISEKLESFTLTYKINAPVAPAGWAEPIGFGWNDWTANKWFTFMYVGDTNLRFTTASARVPGIEPDKTVGNVDGNANQYWGPVIADISTEKTITITVELGGNIVAYVDGNAVLTYETPENYSLSDPTLQFAMGCAGHWGGQNWWTGELSNVAIYDFALTESQVKDFVQYGNVYITKEECIASLLEKYYNNGIYQKDTVINLNEEAKQEAAAYFHAQCNILERTTYYNGNELWMTNASGTVNSGYGTDVNGNMTHFYYQNDQKVVDYTVSIPNKGGMEEYYNTLFDLINLDYSEWTYEKGEFVYTPSTPMNNDEWFMLFRDITAPCFLNYSSENANYLSFSKVTISEVDGQLVLRLYVSSGDSGKITNNALVFSEATFIK